MNLALFFEGTGQGISGKFTNVTRLYDLCQENAAQKRHLESGPGTHFGAYLAGKLHGADWQVIFQRARRWFEQNYETLPRTGTATKVFLFGFSRGALIARHFAAWLDKLGIRVAYMGLWDTVDATLGLDVAEECPGNVLMARHAVSRDEGRRFFQLVPLREPNNLTDQAPYLSPKVEQKIFPGVHSDVGGLYADNHTIADITLAWIAAAAKRAGLRIVAGARLKQACDPAEVVVHTSHNLVSNLFGALAPEKRNLAGIPVHKSCRLARFGKTRKESD